MKSKSPGVTIVTVTKHPISHSVILLNTSCRTWRNFFVKDQGSLRRFITSLLLLCRHIWVTQVQEFHMMNPWHNRKLNSSHWRLPLLKTSRISYWNKLISNTAGTNLKSYLFVWVESIQEKKIHNVVNFIDISVDLKKVVFPIKKVQGQKEFSPNIII